MLSDRRIAVLLEGVVGFSTVRQTLGIGGEGLQYVCDDVVDALRELQRFRSSVKPVKQTAQEMCEHNLRVAPENTYEAPGLGYAREA
jgi:hypothetical protein